MTYTQLLDKLCDLKREVEIEQARLIAIDNSGMSEEAADQHEIDYQTVLNRIDDLNLTISVIEPVYCEHAVRSAAGA